MRLFAFYNRDFSSADGQAGAVGHLEGVGGPVVAVHAVHRAPLRALGLRFLALEDPLRTGDLVGVNDM